MIFTGRRTTTPAIRAMNSTERSDNQNHARAGHAGFSVAPSSRCAAPRSAVLSGSNRIFSFTSFEQWDDKRPLSIVRTVPTELERRGDFSQSTLSGRVRTIYNPFASTHRSLDGPRRPSGLRRQRDSVVHVRPGRGEDAGRDPLPNVPGYADNLAGQRSPRKWTTGTCRSAWT